MQNVAIVGVGQTKYGEHVDWGIKELFAEAFKEMCQSVDKGLDPQRIQAAYIGTLAVGGFQLGQSAPLLTGYIGLPDIPSFRVENACASGGFALLSGIYAIASGAYDVLLVGGVEKMRDLSSLKTKYWLGISGDTEFERLSGLTFAGIYALIANRYMSEFGLQKKHLSMIAVKNHKHGAQNPKAQFQQEIDIERALNGVSVAYPLNVYDCCPTSDGAAALLICSAKVAKEFTNDPVYIIGYGAGSDYLAVHDRDRITSLAAVTRAAREAYSRAGVTPKDIHVAEVHDCFTIAEVLAYGDLGFCDKEKVGRFIEEEATSIGGILPINPSGGLKAKGHPIGATGVGQASEIFNQLRGQADKAGRQVPKCDIGLSHNVGGSGGTATVFIYSRRLGNG